MVTNGEGRPFSDPELRRSLAVLGPLMPVLEFAGRRLDGRRRQRMCAELGIEIRTIAYETREQAAAALWAVHPDRALREFPIRSLKEGSRLFGARPAAVALHWRRTKAEQSKYHDGAGKQRAQYKGIVRKCTRYCERCEQGIEPLTTEGLRRVLAP